MERLSTHNREGTICELQRNKFDLLIIGGGITGAGIALDAVSRGLRTALIEKNDFAWGTSSRSTKLIHGGLRYLKQFEIMLVREMGHERAVLHRLAPHLVRSGKMMLPILENGAFGKFTTSVGLMLYDFLAGVESEDQRKMLDREETIFMEPLLAREDLEGAAVYAEYRTDDARLTIEVMKTAVNYGAVAMNYLSAVDFIYNENVVCGVLAKDGFTGEKFEINTKYVVSAAGPWVDELRMKDKSFNEKKLHLSKGVHIVLAHETFPVRHAIYFNSHDDRMVFAIPRGKVTYVGTTDTDFQDRPTRVTASQEDVQYLVKAVNSAFNEIQITVSDIISSWAGLRPLIDEEGKDVTEISRKDEIFISGTGLVSIAGGKLTGYRKMAEKIIDTLLESDNGTSIDRENLKDECFTDAIPLVGGDFAGDKELEVYTVGIARRMNGYRLTREDAQYLVSNYGRQCDEIIDSMRDIEEQDPALRLLKAEALFSIGHELVHTLLDFFVRRTGRMYFWIESVEQYYLKIAEYFHEILGWNEKRLVNEKKDVEGLLFESRNFS